MEDGFLVSLLVVITFCIGLGLGLSDRDIEIKSKTPDLKPYKIEVIGTDTTYYFKQDPKWNK